MITKEIKMIIKVDEKNIDKKYPNYSINWNNPESFINYLAKSKEEKCLKAFGYSITIKK